jgi:hypothetical protein
MEIAAYLSIDCVDGSSCPRPGTKLPHTTRWSPGAFPPNPIRSFLSRNVEPHSDRSVRQERIGQVSYVDRIPVEQSISIDGFRDQLIGLQQDGNSLMMPFIIPDTLAIRS